jgi:hypothetical protein
MLRLVDRFVMGHVFNRRVERRWEGNIRGLEDVCCCFPGLDKVNNNCLDLFIRAFIAGRAQPQTDRICRSERYRNNGPELSPTYPTGC